MIRLTRREKLLTCALVSFVVFWGLFMFAVRPAIARIETLNRLIPEKQDELRKLCAMSNEYIFLRDSLDDLHTKVASQGESFELLPFLESLIQECDLAEKVATMKQRVSQLEPNYYETIVEVRLDNLTLAQLIDFLWKVEGFPQSGGPSKPLVKTKSLHIKKSLTNTDLLDSVVEIHNAKLVQS